jgi:SAM-dependent methyltransferase
VQGYREDLAYIHDVGHSDYALGAAPGILSLLRRHGVSDGLVIDLGCGSGQWARELNRAGYRVLGVDQSPAMIRLARRKAPRSQFRIASLHEVTLPSCDGVTSIGECLNYAFDGRRPSLRRLFQRIFRALRPGGIFVLDFAGPARIPNPRPRWYWTEGRDWAVLSCTDGDPRRQILQRRIVSFRKTGRLYRRDEELHVLRLYPAEVVAATLADCGFSVETRNAFGRFRLPAGICGIVAVKA